MLLDKQKLENVLIAHWTEFLNVRELMGILSDVAGKYLAISPARVEKVSLSRFEPLENAPGYTLWAEYTVGGQRLTSEFTLAIKGPTTIRRQFTHVRTVSI